MSRVEVIMWVPSIRHVGMQFVAPWCYIYSFRCYTYSSFQNWAGVHLVMRGDGKGDCDDRRKRNLPITMRVHVRRTLNQCTHTPLIKRRGEGRGGTSLSMMDVEK